MTKAQKHMANVASIGCIVCVRTGLGNTPAEVHHILKTESALTTSRCCLCEVDSDSIIELGGKVKFPEYVVRFVGDAKSATDYLWENEPRSRDVAVIGACRAEKQGGAKVVVGALGTATAGEYGVIAIEYYDAKAGVYRKRIGTIGEDGLKPNVAYKLDENNRFVKAK